MPRARALLVALLVLGTAAPAAACLWDYDTLKMERRQFPGALELITGKFLRHGEAFYRWRIQDRTARLADAPENLALYDDLAVAHDKVGEPEKAIQVMLDKQKRKAGRYETEANLGTFYIHAGDLEKGLVHIGKAIEINPEAHFGREIYQQLLVEYVLTKKQDGTLPLPMNGMKRGHGRPGFARFVLDRRQAHLPKEPVDGKDPWDIELAKATKGVLGMMRFGHHDSPVLLEALGDLLLAGGERDGAKRLGSRAYLKASYEVKEAAQRSAYRALAKQSLSMQTVHPNTTTELTLAQLEKSLRAELADARAWHAEVLANERRWIEAGEDVDARFAETYYGTPPPKAPAKTQAEARNDTLVTLGVILAVVVLASVLLFLLRRATPSADRFGSRRESRRRSARAPRS